MREVLKKYLDNDEALDAYIDSKTTYLSVDDVEIILNRFAQQTTHPLNLELEQLRKERDELKTSLGMTEESDIGRTEYIEELEEQLQAEKQKNEELRKGIEELIKNIPSQHCTQESVINILEKLLTK